MFRRTAIYLAPAIVVALASCAGTSSSSSNSPAAPSTLRLTVETCSCLAPEQVAIQKGWLQDLLNRYHVTLKTESFDSGPPQIAALVSGSLDIGAIGVIPAVSLMAQDAPVDFFYVSDQGLGAEGLVVKLNSGIQGPMDLIGKKVGVAFGGSGEFMLRAELGVAQVDPSKVSLVNLTPSAMVAAWQRNDIQAAYVFDPFLSQLKGLGGQVLVTDGDVVTATGGLQNATWDVYAVRRDFAQRYPKFVRDFAAVLARATDYTNANKRQVADTLYTAIAASSPDDAYNQLQGEDFITASQNSSAEWLGTPGQVGKIVDKAENVAKFLYSRGAIRHLPSRSEIASHMNGSFLS